VSAVAWRKRQMLRDFGLTSRCKRVLRSFWNFTQRRVVLSYWRFGRT